MLPACFHSRERPSSQIGTSVRVPNSAAWRITFHVVVTGSGA